MREQDIYLQGLKYKVEVLLDYQNLVYFITIKQLNRRQVRQAEILALYNFKIHYVQGKENTQANALSRKPKYLSNKIIPSRAILKGDRITLMYNRTQLATIFRLKDKTFKELIKKGYN